MIEHDIEFISRLCDPVIVMAEGCSFNGQIQSLKLKKMKKLSKYILEETK